MPCRISRSKSSMEYERAALMRPHILPRKFCFWAAKASPPYPQESSGFVNRRLVARSPRRYGVRPGLPGQDARHGGVDLVRRVGPLLADEPQRPAILVPQVRLLPVAVPDVPGVVGIAVMTDGAAFHGRDEILQRIAHLLAPVGPPLHNLLLAVPPGPYGNPLLPIRRVGVHAPDIVALKHLLDCGVYFIRRHLPVFLAAKGRLPQSDKPLVARFHVCGHQGRSVPELGAVKAQDNQVAVLDG